MLIGSKQQLAMEYEIVPSSGSAILGHFCMWINGYMIGDLSDTFVLTVAQGGIENSLECSDQRIDSALFAMEKAEAMSFLRDVLYGETGMKDPVATWSKYRCFNLKQFLISSTKNLWIFLIADSTQQRLLWCRDDQREVVEAKFPTGTYEAVAREFLREFSNETSGSHARH
jgi:hypothetical protein